MDPLKIEGIEKVLRHLIRAFRDRATARPRPALNIPRVFSNFNDDSDSDAAPDAFVGARLRPRHPLGGSAVELPEPDEDLIAEAVGPRHRP